MLELKLNLIKTPLSFNLYVKTYQQSTLKHTYKFGEYHTHCHNLPQTHTLITILGRFHMYKSFQFICILLEPIWQLYSVLYLCIYSTQGGWCPYTELGLGPRIPAPVSSDPGSEWVRWSLSPSHWSPESLCWCLPRSSLLLLCYFGSYTFWSPEPRHGVLERNN